MNDIQIAMTGNLVDAPDLSVTPKGTSVAKFRIASTPRMQKNGQWVDAGDTVFLTAVAWRNLAETAAKTLHKGQRVTVTGKLRQRNYVTESGAKRSVYEIQADTIAVTLSTSSTDAATEAPAEVPAVTEPTVDAPVEVAA